MDEADHFVLADTFQYSRQSFQNRARLRTPQGWQWISVPLKGRQHGRPVREVEIWERPAWLRKHARAFAYNYRATPYYEYYEPEMARLFDARWTHLAALTCATVAMTRKLLGITTPVVRASELPGRPSTLPDVMQAMQAETLLVPPEAAAHDGPLVPRVAVMSYNCPPYRQNFDGFEPGMSTVDVLFNHGPEALTILRSGVHLAAG